MEEVTVTHFVTEWFVHQILSSAHAKDSIVTIVVHTQHNVPAM